MKTAPIVTRAEHLASLVAAIGVTVGIALLVVAASGSRFVAPLALHRALDARRASEHLVYVTPPVPPPAVAPTRRAVRPSARPGVPTGATSPAREGMMTPPPDSASFAAAADTPAATIPRAVSDTASRQVLRAAIPLGAPVAAATVGFTRRSSQPVRFDSVLRSVSDSIGIGLTLGVLKPPPLTQAEQDARWRAEAFEVAAARGAGVPLRRTMAGGSIPIPLPFGGPSRKQRERERAIEAQLKVVRALRQRRDFGAAPATVAGWDRLRSFSRVLPQSDPVQLVRSTSAIFLATAALATPASSQQRGGARTAAPYVPGATWERRDPAAAGFDPTRLTAAIAFAVQSDAKAPRDMEESHYRSFGREPFGQGIGPFKPRGEPSGVILRGGYIVATWGEPDRVDMTHSVTKSFLSTVVGVAVDRGLIPSVRDTVWKSQAPIYRLRLQAPSEPGTTTGESMFFDPFATPHNRTITWDDMLRQTSDWEGTLWGKPEWADRPSQNAAEWRTRARARPGTTYEYNDVRVNALALAATNVWRRPLPEVLRDYVMEPIGASQTWRWYGYDNAWITLDGRPVQVVSGGGHWGGGMFINAWDMARFGLLTLRRGMWGDKRILSEAWVKMALTPTGPQPTYGFMNWFLNTDRKWMPSAPPNAFGHVGNGTNLVFVSPDQDLVAVVRWIDNGSIDAFLGKLLGAVAR